MESIKKYIVYNGDKEEYRSFSCELHTKTSDLLVIFRKSHANADSAQHEALKQALEGEEGIVGRGKLDKGVGLVGSEGS